MSKKILVIDDDELNRKILFETLDCEGFEVVEAEDGKQGLERMEENPDVAVVLVDRMMPVMDGVEFIRHFSRNLDWKKIPVIMQTAANNPKDVISGNQLGVYYYLTKPFEEETIIGLVNAALEDSASDDY